jgi:hypothetical protein
MRRLACPPASPVKRQARLEPWTIRSQPRRGRRPQIGAEQPTIETHRHQLRREARDLRNERKRSQVQSGATSPFGREVLALVRVIVRNQACLAGEVWKRHGMRQRLVEPLQSRWFRLIS